MKITGILLPLLALAAGSTVVLADPCGCPPGMDGTAVLRKCNAECDDRFTRVPAQVACKEKCSSWLGAHGCAVPRRRDVDTDQGEIDERDVGSWPSRRDDSPVVLDAAAPDDDWEIDDRDVGSWPSRRDDAPEILDAAAPDDDWEIDERDVDPWPSRGDDSTKVARAAVRTLASCLASCRAIYEITNRCPGNLIAIFNNAFL